MQPQNQKPRPRLPYERRRMDFPTWVYVHRAGLCATLALLLVFGIAFVGWKIGAGGRPVPGVVYVALETPPEELQKSVEEVRPVDYGGSVSNRASNENADLDPELRDSRGRDASDLYNDAAALGDRMNANREAYEAGLRQNRERIDDAGRRLSDDGDPGRTARVQGNVTASYSFADPVRRDEFLDIPAYRCKGGGRVVVVATLDRNGTVVEAAVDRAASTDNDCLRREAVNSARASRFNLDPSAPARQRGTITYLFVQQ